MNIDAALRYKPVVDDILKNSVKGEVLEIGSGTNGISDFYDGNVVGIDENFEKTAANKNSNIRHKQGTIIKIPCADESFHNVVCMDVFEHLNPKMRETGVQELLRVCGCGGTVYIGFPTGNWSHRAERSINFLYKAIHKIDHPWLQEHLHYGLPPVKKIRKVIEKQKIKQVQEMRNVNILVWFLLHILVTVCAGTKVYRFTSKLAIPLYEISQALNLPPYYRIILIIRK